MKTKYLQVICLLSFMLVMLFGVKTDTTVYDEVNEVREPVATVAECNLNVSSGFSNALSDLSTLSIEAPEYLVVAASTEVVEPEPEPEIVENEVDLQMYVTTSLNVRCEPDADAEKIGALSVGKPIHVIGILDNGWAHIEVEDAEAAYVNAEYLSEEQPLLLVSSTAYYDKYNRGSASGRRLVAGKSLAGKVSWLGKHVRVYRCNKDGSAGDLMGEYRFDDTGYGAPSGYGESKILKGKTVGTIENGTCIDVFFNTLDECRDYGRRNVYIQFIDE